MLWLNCFKPIILGGLIIHRIVFGFFSELEFHTMYPLDCHWEALKTMEESDDFVHIVWLWSLASQFYWVWKRSGMVPVLETKGFNCVDYTDNPVSFKILGEECVSRIVCHPERAICPQRMSTLPFSPSLHATAYSHEEKYLHQGEQTEMNIPTNKTHHVLEPIKLLLFF